MPRLTTIPEVWDMPEDTIVHVIKGKIKAIYKTRKGTSQPKGNNPGKPYCFQDLYIEDNDGNELKITLNDRADLPNSWQGTVAYFLASKSEKHGWTGVKTKDDTYKNETKRILWVTPSAEVLSAGDWERKENGDQGGSAEAPDERRGGSQGQERRTDAGNGQQGRTTAPNSQQSRPSETTQRREPGPERRETRQNATGGDGNRNPAYEQEAAILNAKKSAGKLANVYCLALLTARTVQKRDEVETGKAWDMDIFQAAVSSFFISLTRDAHLERTLPGKPVDWLAGKAPAPAPAPTPAKETPPPKQQPKPPSDDFIPDPDEDDVPF